MSAEVKILQTENGWKVIATDSTDLKVELDGNELIVRVRPTVDTGSQQPLDVKLQ